MLDVEAEEEEEDEQGLGDFGFTFSNNKKKEEGESEKVIADEDDFENIVDQLSDDEGDEDEGNVKRQEMKALQDAKDKEEVLYLYRVHVVVLLFLG